MEKANILVVDDEKDICMALNFLLTKERYSVKEAYTGEEALELIKKENFDVVMTDIKMDKMDGFAVLREAQKFSPRTSVIMMTAFESVLSAIEAMQAGAADFITKPFRNDEIRRMIKRLLHIRDLRMENEILRQELNRRHGAIVGAIPENLLVSEFFGHKKGAFTSAKEDKKDIIPMANDGTLFLDEIGELPQALQVKILHVIQMYVKYVKNNPKGGYDIMNKLTKKFEDLMVAITFAESGEYDEVSSLLGEKPHTQEDRVEAMKGFEKIALEKSGK